MSIPNTTTSHTYTGTGATDTYPYTFQIWDSGDIEVIEVDGDGVETTLTYTTNYTLTGVGESSGGNVVRVAGNLPSGYTWIVRTQLDAIQESVYRIQSVFDPATLERDLDRLCRMVQQINRLVSPSNEALARALLLKLSGTDGATYYAAKGNRINNLGTPTALTDAVTKQYVDQAVGSPIDIPIYTSGSRPVAADVPGRTIILKDPGVVAILQVSAPNAADDGYTWESTHIFSV